MHIAHNIGSLHLHGTDSCYMTYTVSVMCPAIMISLNDALATIDPPPFRGVLVSCRVSHLFVAARTGVGTPLLGENVPCTPAKGLGELSPPAHFRRLGAVTSPSGLCPFYRLQQTGPS